MDTEENDMKADEENTLNCYICGQPIDAEDWLSNNVKQTSFGLMHFLCPNKLIISNIPNSMDDAALYELFKSFGSILEAHINGNVALIEFESKQSAKKAMAKMNGFEIESNNKLLIKYAHINEEKQQQNNKKQRRYIQSKESLRSMSAMQIVSMLVTEKKKFREMNKKWMRLIIAHKQNEDVINFIFECDANDATKDFVYGCVPMSSYLESLLALSDEQKYEKSAKYVQNEVRPSWLPSQHIILVCGFIRKKVEKRLRYSHYHWIIPTVIVDICFKFYCSITSICVLDSTSFTKFDFNHNNVTISNQEHPGKELLSCIHIPNIEPSHFPNLSFWMGMMLSSDKPQSSTTYSALFGCNKEQTHIHFILRESEKNCWTFSTDIHKIALYKTSQFVFCGLKHGVCVLGEDGLYQLKLRDVNTENYKFSKICRFQKWRVSTDYSLCYLVGRDKILAVQMNHEPTQFYNDYVLKCAMFDFETLQWNEIASMPNCKNLHNAFYVYDCGTAMVYNDHNRSFVYALSVEGSLCKYDLNEDKWSVEIKYFEGLHGDRWTKRKPILWFDGFQHHILYCAIWTTPREIAFYNVDLSVHHKQWKLCVDWNKMIKNMSWNNKAMLFK